MAIRVCPSAGSHCVIFVSQGRTEQCHDPVAHHLVDRALITVHGFHHVFQDRIQEFPRVLWILIRQQFHRTLHVSEQHRDLLALAFESALRGENFFGKVFGSVGSGRTEARCYGLLSTHRLPTLKTELRASRDLSTARSAL